MRFDRSANESWQSQRELQVSSLLSVSLCPLGKLQLQCRYYGITRMSMARDFYLFFAEYFLENFHKLYIVLIPELTARSAVRRGLLIPLGYLHPGKCEHSEVQSHRSCHGRFLSLCACASHH